VDLETTLVFIEMKQGTSMLHVNPVVRMCLVSTETLQESFDQKKDAVQIPRMVMEKAGTYLPLRVLEPQEDQDIL